MRSVVKERTKIHPSHHVSYSACIQEAGWGSLVWEANQVAFFENWQMCLVSLAIRVNRDRQDNTILSTLKTMARHHKPCRGLIILEPLPFSPPLLSIIKKPNPSFWSRYLLEWHIQVTCFRLQRYTAAQSSGGGRKLFTAGKFHPFSTPAGFWMHWSVSGVTMTEVEFHVIVTTALSGVLVVAVVALLCYFTCRLAGSLPLGGPGTF